ncbi:hypothetical protein GGI1_04150 [Acidithiobacillus sp. GGI-221]|jgi:hypothetical protein|nr:hypothetical protein GGI1_04150 [Acidithiobacillus sp. GGI-221]
MYSRGSCTVGKYFRNIMDGGDRLRLGVCWYEVARAGSLTGNKPCEKVGKWLTLMPLIGILFPLQVSLLTLGG